jgi:hypothetical protein
MANDLFVLGLAVLAVALLAWGFRTLPHEEWQIAASIPVAKDPSGHWRGLNLTYYGLLQANGYVSGVAMALVLLEGIGVRPGAAVTLAILILGICAPASKVVARWVEGRRSGFTVGGAVFVGILVAPSAIQLTNSVVGPLLDFHVPLLPALAALAVGYAIGEGTGRLACVSFGCCYGKPVAQVPPRLQRLFARRSFVFTGKTKKVVYEGGLEGQRVVPVQAMTAVLFVACGLAGAACYLRGWHGVALALCLVVTQAWRVVSEMLRADYRGGGRFTAYQRMAALGVVYLVGILAILPREAHPPADVVRGLAALWDPTMILFLQGLWVAIFLYTGRSEVTASTLSFHVVRERS